MSGVLVRRTVLRPADAVGEAFTSIVARPAVATATGFGTLLAVGWFVAVLGLVSTASGQVASTFAQRLPTAILVTAPVPRLLDAPFPFPGDVERRVDALTGVVASGVYWRVRPRVVAGTPGYLAAAGAAVSQGRLFDAWDQAHAADVCVVGAELARSLGIGGLGRPHTIYIDHASCFVAGIVSDAVRQPYLLRSVVLPTSAATALFGPPDQRTGARPAVLIETRPGAAPAIARQVRYAINPARPHRLTVSMRQGPVLLRRQVTGTMRSLFVTVGWAGLAVGVVAIAGLTSFCVLQRSPEFALRRALGARRRHIAAQILAESVMIGLLGGLAGASLGIAAVVLIARAMHWTPVVAPLALWPAPLIGAAAGMIAGIAPAIRAAWIRPAAGLSRFPPV